MVTKVPERPGKSSEPSSDVNKASNIKAKDLILKAKAMNININEAFNAKVK
jgi:hypothetical protein